MAQLPEAWIEFFATAAGASATLVGLVIVAVSVNVQRILAFRHLPSRAGATVGALILNLIGSMAALIPQPAVVLAVEIVVFGITEWLWQTWSARQTLVSRAEHRRPLWEMAFGISIGQFQVIPFIIGGILLLAGQGSGLFWIAAGIIATFVFSTVSVDTPGRNPALTRWCVACRCLAAGTGGKYARCQQEGGFAWTRSKHGRAPRRSC